MAGLQLKEGVRGGAGPTAGNQGRHVEDDLGAQRTCHRHAHQVCGEGQSKCGGCHGNKVEKHLRNTVKWLVVNAVE